VVAVLGAAAVVGIAGCGSSTASSAAAPATSAPSTSASSHSMPGGRPGSGAGGNGGGSNARSGPAEGGTIGTVSATSSSGFTVSTSTGQKVTVTDTSSTTYQQDGNSATASVVAQGAVVEVLGTVDSTTITAAQVILEPSSALTGTSSNKAIAFAKGSQAVTKTVGNIPSNYTEGSGTIQSGSTADKVAEAALAAYPGGVVDRVVLLSNGEYEAHTIGVAWPHHVFVNQQDQAVGAY
jgi:hypothetical protein